MLDGYFTVRLTQMLNQAKTAFVGVPQQHNVSCSAYYKHPLQHR